jgi:(p)ppGpp synthase/HD superfamily hydrolase
VATPEGAPEPHSLTARFDEAVAYASALHRGETRRDGRTPYLAHLLGVASIVLADAGSEDAAIAALLHDAVRHPDDIPILNEIRRRFGVHVGELVLGCADHDPARDRPAWEVRKAQHVAKLHDVELDVLRILLADALYNARELLVDHARVGEAVFDRYSAGTRIVEHLRALAEVFAERLPGPLAQDLDRTVRELETVAQRVPA